MYSAGTMADQRFHVETHGKLIAARVFGLRTVDDANDYSTALGNDAARLPTAVLLADHRPVVIYPQDVADRLAELFIAMNTRLDRVAIIVARSNATLALQLERLVRQAKYTNRRVFYAPDDAIAHLEPVLSAPEIARAREFLVGIRPS